MNAACLFRVSFVLCILIASSMLFGGMVGAEEPVNADFDAMMAEFKEYQRLNAVEKYAEALPHAEKMVEFAKKAGGEESKDYAVGLNNVALLYFQLNQFGKAESLYLRALPIYEKQLGSDHVDSVTCICNLAKLYFDMGEYGKAEPLYQRALAAREKQSGTDHRDTADSLHYLALLYCKMSQFERAEPLYIRVLKIYEREYGADHANTASCLNDLAELYRLNKKYEKAEPLHQRALAMREKLLGLNHRDTAFSLNNSALLYQEMGQSEKAEALYKRALSAHEEHFGPEHIETAVCLTNFGKLYTGLAQHLKAEPLYLRALAIREKQLGPDHALCVASLRNLAGLYRAIGKYEKAEPMYRRALAIREKQLGPEHLDTASSLIGLALLLDDMNQFEKAEPLYQRALAIREKQLGEHPDTATSLSKLAFLYSEMFQFEKAEALYLRAQSIREKKLESDHPDIAVGLSNLGSLYVKMAEYGKAEPLCQRALAIHEKRFGPDHPRIVESLDGLGSLYFNMGQYGKAEPLFQRALSIREKHFGPDHLNTAISLASIADLYRHMGQYIKAVEFYYSAMTIREKQLGSDHLDTAASVHAWALGIMDAGNLEGAESPFQKALAIHEKILGPDHPQTANCLNSLAGLYLRMNQFAKAEPLYRRALIINEKQLGPSHPDTANSLNSLAEIYRSLEQYEKAEPLYLRALAIDEKQLGPDHPYTVNVINNIARSNASNGNLKSALEHYQRAQRSIFRHIHHTLPALSEAEQIRFLSARETQCDVSMSFALLSPQHAALTAPWLFNRKAAALACQAERTRLARDTNDPAIGQLATKLTAIRAQLALTTRDAFQPGQESSRLQRIKDLEIQEEAAVKSLGERQSKTILAESWTSTEQVQMAIPADAVLIDIARFHHFDFKAKEDQETWEEDRYAAWIIFSEKAKKDVALVDLGDASEIDDLIQKYRDAAESKTTGASDAMAALAMRVLDPLMPHIRNSERWLISPDAALWLVPWAAMPAEKKELAIEKHCISYLVSARDLADTGYKSKTTAPAILADPDFDINNTNKPVAVDPGAFSISRSAGLAGLKFSALPGTAKEAQAIRQPLAQFTGLEPDFFVREAATKSNFGKLHSPKVVVLSTHGFILSEYALRPHLSGETPAVTNDLNRIEESGLAEDESVTFIDEKPIKDDEAFYHTLDNLGAGWHTFTRIRKDQTEVIKVNVTMEKTGRQVIENPLLRCGLAMAGANNRDKAHGGDDGILSGLEIVAADLRGTDLVVLSACETGVGQVNKGEGVAGLRQCFQLAGANSVVATLWRVDDSKSTELMTQFFKNLSAGQPKADALRNAQLELIKSMRASHQEPWPYYWAPFTLTGKWK